MAVLLGAFVVILLAKQRRRGGGGKVEGAEKKDCVRPSNVLIVWFGSVGQF